MIGLEQDIRVVEVHAQVNGNIYNLKARPSLLHIVSQLQDLNEDGSGIIWRCAWIVDLMTSPVSVHKQVHLGMSVCDPLHHRARH